MNDDGRLAVTQQEIEAAFQDLGQLGTGFWQIVDPDATSLPAYLDALLEVIQDICDFTLVVENHASGRWVPRTSHEMIDQRNFVQHKLMSLKSEQELVNDGLPWDKIDSQYEGCRLACIAYSFLVVFPVPPVVGPFENLTDRMKKSLQACKWTILDGERLRLHLWILIMATIASIGLPDRPWFLLRTMDVLGEFNFKDWKDLRLLLKTYLWHPRTSDFDGIDLWRAIKQADTVELVQ